MVSRRILRGVEVMHTRGFPLFLFLLEIPQ